MNRRDMFRLIPLAGAGLWEAVSPVGAQHALTHSSSEKRGVFSRQYLEGVKRKLTWVREHQAENILEAAYAIARTVERGNNVWCNWDLGHTSSSDLFPGRNGAPEFVLTNYNPSKSKQGDLLLSSFSLPPEYHEDFLKKDLFIIGGPCPWGGDVPGQGDIRPDIQKMRIRQYCRIWIEDNSDNIGAQVKVPGSPAYAGPESGPSGMSVFWMMIADACRALARDGKPSAVKGDEPKLNEKTPRVGLDAPLMDDYFDEVMRQFEMIGMEMGNIRRMAAMAAESLLTGDSVYFYSRYSDTLADEAVERRGGFSFAKGLAEGRKIVGSAKDCVIMGTYQPEDEIDLKNLDQFRKLGMKVASIGPITRDTRLPQGRAVSKETDVHVGRMMDTYGLFALPGFERKVCPTSGAVNCAILWTMNMELIEEIRDRTGGNIPWINMNGALRNGMSHVIRGLTIARERGY